MKPFLSAARPCWLLTTHRLNDWWIMWLSLLNITIQYLVNNSNLNVDFDEDDKLCLQYTVNGDPMLQMSQCLSNLCSALVSFTVISCYLQAVIESRHWTLSLGSVVLKKMFFHFSGMSLVQRKMPLSPPCLVLWNRQQICLKCFEEIQHNHNYFVEFHWILFSKKDNQNF